MKWMGILLAGVVACGGESDVGSDAPPPPTVFGGEREVELQVPSSYDEAEPAPLVFLLHGLGVSADIQEVLFQVGPAAEARGMLFVHPQGTRDSQGRPFWNATDLCCDFDGTDVDDAGYLAGLIEEISAAYAVDPKRIYFTGHSNGHFMSYRMACDHPELVAGIAGLAGAMYSDPSLCAADEPVNVLHVHGTDDDLVPFADAAEPSARHWSEVNGCTSEVREEGVLDLESKVAGTESDVLRWEGCAPGGATELWTMHGGAHIPNLAPDWAEQLLDWMLAHPKP